MANRRLPASEDALELNQIDSNTYITSRYKEGTEQDSDKAIPFKYFQSSPVAICSSTADAVSKIAQVENFPDFALENGREVVVYFENGNIAENPSLNVNNTGSYPIAMETITDATGIKCESGTFYRMTYCDVTSNGVRIRKWIAGASENKINSDIEQTTSAIEELMRILYPVGSIKISENNVNPGTYIPNTTWELKSSGRVLQGADETHNGGDTIEAGLPNITSEWVGRSGNDNTLLNVLNKNDIITGAISKINKKTERIFAGSSNKYEGYDFRFNAKDGETKTDGTLKTASEPHVYGNSDTVQPSAYVVYIWKRTA